ncbi:zinc-dependent alcohol dehydrogenase family protein [Marmoricola sp. URHB0036]|uniref:zinc-dependent alcohol dehydrogenase family protein n=1 Tax=Marmoricola sp. URHB0036 TaxID=1298863 RepID=UPI00040B7702|nr:zinc-dependent alcohol dehydrogenase family protein [Marmoricola sp. URHB0036]
MRATTIHAARDIRLEERPTPSIEAPTDAIVRVTAGCICGSDLWPYRGENDITPGDTIGHEMIGVVEEVGSGVSSFGPGDFVIAPFCHCDNTCAHCRAGAHSACVNVGFTQSGQAEYARVTQAEGSLVKTDGMPPASLLPSLLTLSDVFPTGWHCAVSADVSPGDTVVVVGDGAVGLCGVLAAAEMGAERVIAMSRHEQRQEIARQFGATHIVAERGKEGAERIKELTDGVGADAVLECVGTDDSMKQAFACARPGSTVGFVGVPHGVELPVRRMFSKNIGLAGGVAPVRRYLPELLELVTDGTVDPGLVFDLTLPLDKVAEGYRAMDERTAIKVYLEVS